MTMRKSSVEPIPGCPPEIGYSLWTLEETRRRTLNYVDGIGQEALDHSPVSRRHGVATLLYHIAVFEMDWLYVDMLGGGYDMERRVPQCPPEVAAQLPYPLLLEDGGYTPVSGEPLETHLTRLSTTRDALLNVVGSMTVADFHTLRPSGDDMVTPEWIVEHLSQHEAEHRGQIWEARVAAELAIEGS
jgi:uncharacterized damage-inducible protein DinB